MNKINYLLMGSVFLFATFFYFYLLFPFLLKEEVLLTRRNSRYKKKTKRKILSSRRLCSVCCKKEEKSLANFSMKCLWDFFLLSSLFSEFVMFPFASQISFLLYFYLSIVIITWWWWNLENSEKKPSSSRLPYLLSLMKGNTFPIQVSSSFSTLSPHALRKAFSTVSEKKMSKKKGETTAWGITVVLDSRTTSDPFVFSCLYSRIPLFFSTGVEDLQQDIFGSKGGSRAKSEAPLARTTYKF